MQELDWSSSDSSRDEDQEDDRGHQKESSYLPSQATTTSTAEYPMRKQSTTNKTTIMIQQQSAVHGNIRRERARSSHGKSKDRFNNSESKWNSSPLKEKVIDDEYVKLCFILQKKHEDCGRRIKENDVFETKELNELCRYCLMEIHTEEHAKECLFIPEWIREGYTKPDGEYKRLTKVEMFNNHQYKLKPYRGDKPTYDEVQFYCLCPNHVCACDLCPWTDENVKQYLETE